MADGTTDHQAARSNARRRRRRARAGLALLAAALGLASAGCQLFGSGGPGYDPALAPITDRLIAAYDDLESKRFQILADFESPEQASLFRHVANDLSHPMTVSAERSRRETGAGSLKMTLADASQQVMALDSPESDWALHRDWSSYPLLLFSVYSPRPVGGFTFSVRSGTDIPLTYRHEPIPLKEGWNLIRADLARMGEEIGLSDVRELRFWCEPLDEPIELYLDDVILADNTKTLFGDPQAEPGDLYVRSLGRRIVVGAIERFELVFQRGRIIQWFDLATDSERLHNLAGAGVLGPAPVVVSDPADPNVDLDDTTQWAGLGLGVESYQGMVEASPLRVTIQGQWRFVSPGDVPGDATPAHRWLYTVDAQGRVFVECTGTARSEGFAPPALGMVFGCDGDARFVPHVVTDERAPFALFSRQGRGQADLLIVPAGPLAGQLIRPANDPRQCVLWHWPTSGEQFTFCAMMQVQATDLDTPQAALARVTDYAAPLPIAVDTGRLVLTDEGDHNNDGYSEGRGYYVLQLDGKVAKVRIDGRQRTRFAPTFRLVDVADREVWVYVDGRPLKSMGRLPEGDVLFTVPETVASEVLVEVIAAEKDSRK